MNFIAISPQFPKTYWNFCDRLKRNGHNVLGIGDMPYDQLSAELKASLNEYYWVSNMQDYDQMLRAVAFFTHKYGKIDWLESNNEFWLEQDARLRTDFNIDTGAKSDLITKYKHKSQMKAFYQKAGIPTARYHLTTTLEEGRKFIEEVGYPVVVKPDNGVGAYATYKLTNDDELEGFYESNPQVQYIMEEFIDGTIYSYDAICNSKSQPLFETSHCFPTSIMDIVNTNVNDCSYYTLREIPQELIEKGRKALKAFKVKSRFVHFEFFKLNIDHEGLGKKGDFVALEVNMRPAGGYTPDMINYANQCDIYQIYADMVSYDDSFVENIDRRFYCTFASKKDQNIYAHSDEQIRSKYLSNLRMMERMPDVLSSALGNMMFTACFSTLEEALDFIKYVQKPGEMKNED